MTGIGIDIGSVATKAAVVSDGRLAGKAVLRTGTEPRSAGEKAVREALASAGIRAEGLPLIATGYGRRAAQTGARTITEIQAAARGVHHLVADAEAVIDLGGQDTKVIRLGAGGAVAEFAMNDKCAAGTGRFLELMATALGVDLADLSALAERSANPARMDSTCAVFAESEVVSLIARGVALEDIAAGLYAAIAARIAGLASRAGQASRYVFIGGGAKSAAMKAALEAKLGAPLFVPAEPQFVVAVGAALTACRS